MGKNILKIALTFVLFLGIGQRIFAQGVEENSEVKGYLDNMFSTLDKSKVPNGLLRDYAFELTDLDKYTGDALTDKNYVDREIYTYLLRTIRSAALGSKPYRDVNEILASQLSAGGENVVSLSAMAYQYSYIKENALTDQLIRFQNGRVCDNIINGVWRNPYDTKYVIGFATQDSVFKTQTLTFKLNSDCWFTNLSYAKIEIDPDGNGYRQISVGGTISVSYASSGQKELKMRTTLTNGKQLISHSKIHTKANTVTRAGVSQFNEPIIKVGNAYKGVNTVARVFIRTRNGLMRNPLIVVEGFDPLISGGYGFQTADGFYNECITSPYGQRILAEYDIIYVDWESSEEYIQANANTLIKVIQEVNQRKMYSGSTAENVIIGSSMGGLITRYALKTMENQNLMHQTSIYVSHDSPHLGANIPVGLLYTLYGIGSFLENKLNIGNIYNLATGRTLGNMLKQIHSNAAKQMLVNYVDFDGMINNTVHDLWQQELSGLGFPQGDPNKPLKMIALVNGSYNPGTVPLYYLLANATGSTDLLDVANILTGGLSAVFIGFVLNDFWTGVLSLVPGKSTIKGSLDIRPGTSPGAKVTELSFKYIKKFLWTIPITKTIFSYKRFMPGGLAYDIFPSSRYNTKISANDGGPFVPSHPILGEYTYDISTEESIPFVPTSSALAARGALTASLFTTKPTSSNTPFGENILMRNLQSDQHVNLTDNDFEWLYAQFKMGINGSKLGKTGSRYSIINSTGISPIWSTSNSSIATINSSGILSVTGKGVVDIIAQVGNTTTSRRIAVGTPRFVLTNATREPGFYSIKAQCVDNEIDFADLITQNKDIVTYQWGIKIENYAIKWIDSESSTIKLSTMEDNVNTTVYLKVKDANGNISTPIFIRITGYDIYDIGFTALILNKNGKIYTDNGYELYYENTGLPLIFRNASYDEFSDAKWSPLAGRIINEEGIQWVVPWYTNFYIKDIIPPTEIERIKSTCPDNKISIYSFFLLNYEGRVIQRTPLTVIYKANYPNI